MKFNEISKRYTEIVMDFINDGYYFNITTMSGTQGEMAHTDLTDGVTIIRIVMSEFRDWKSEKEGVEIIVGVCTDESVKPNRKGGYNTIWNNKLEVIRSEKFYQVGRENRSGDKFYGTEEESNAAINKSRERYEARRICNKQELSEDAKKIVLSYIKRQPKCKSVKISDIESVYRIISYNQSNKYYVEAKGKRYILK